jgi:hypothetical protein
MAAPRESYECKSVDGLKDKIQKKLDKGFLIESSERVKYQSHERYLDAIDEKHLNTKCSKYETDLLISENIDGNKIPRIIIEVKVKTFSTHDVITYSDKAMAHKVLYPHLRYGFLVLEAEENNVPSKFIQHNKAFDFVFLANKEEFIEEFMKNIIKPEIKVAQALEKIYFSNTHGKDRIEIGNYLRYDVVASDLA